MEKITYVRQFMFLMGKSTCLHVIIYDIDMIRKILN